MMTGRGGGGGGGGERDSDHRTTLRFGGCSFVT